MSSSSTGFMLAGAKHHTEVNEPFWFHQKNWQRFGTGEVEQSRRATIAIEPCHCFSVCNFNPFGLLRYGT